MARNHFVMAALATAVVVAACRAPIGTEPESMPAFRKAGAVGLAASPQLALCPKAAYDSVAVAVGPQGGTVVLGKHSLAIPRNSLAQQVTISMVIPGDSTASVRFHPDGLQFNWLAPPVLTLSYKGCLTGPSPQITYIDDQFNLLQFLSTLFLDTTNKQVQSYIQHFSRYAVAW